MSGLRQAVQDGATDHDRPRPPALCPRAAGGPLIGNDAYFRLPVAPQWTSYPVAAADERCGGNARGTRGAHVDRDSPTRHASLRRCRPPSWQTPRDQMKLPFARGNGLVLSQCHSNGASTRQDEELRPSDYQRKTARGTRQIVSRPLRVQNVTHSFVSFFRISWHRIRGSRRSSCGRIMMARHDRGPTGTRMRDRVDTNPLPEWIRRSPRFSA